MTNKTDNCDSPHRSCPSSSSSFRWWSHVCPILLANLGTAIAYVQAYAFYNLVMAIIDRFISQEYRKRHAVFYQFLFTLFVFSLLIAVTILTTRCVQT